MNEHSPQAFWFVIGLVLLLLLGMYAPRVAAFVFILLATYLVLEFAGKGWGRLHGQA